MTFSWTKELNEQEAGCLKLGAIVGFLGGVVIGLILCPYLSYPKEQKEMTITVKELYDATLAGTSALARQARDNPDMPCFLLLAQDQHAAGLVEKWAIHVSTGIPDASEHRGTHDKVHEARVISKLMYRWPVHKIPD